ncbi:MAG TPA: SDR family NAD(P)-dependent oxidoreductase, partial [Thermodesulfovibrionales bacterium]|nr:SDR family NAD(P)-dependent oxidoreductase [Thermodesulfovibrionales bacterium]
VVINYLHSHKDAGELAQMLGTRAVAIRADVGSLEEVKDMVEKVRDLWERVDVLVNNAGVVRDGLLIGYQERDFDEVLRVNLKGCFNTVRTLAPLMAKSGGAHIVNISSTSGLKGRVGQAAYSAAKAGVIGFSLSAARELAELNIMVNAVLPGYMPTDMGKGAEEAIRRATQESVLGTLSEPSEVARFIALLVTSKNVSGQVFCLDSRI